MCAPFVVAGLLLWGADGSRAAETSLGYTLDVMANARGGLDTGLAEAGLLDLAVHTDDRFLGLPGVEALLHVQYTHGRGPTETRVGDLQAISNIEAPPALRPLEAWVSAPLPGLPAARATLGLIDLNGIFDVQDVGALFVGSSHGIGPDFSQSGHNGPSIFPTTGPALVVEAALAPSWSGRLGVFDGVPGNPERPRHTNLRLSGSEGALLVAELEHAFGTEAEVQLGVWRYTKRFDPILPRHGRGRSQGAYGMVQTELWTSGKSTLAGWLRVGVASSKVNPIGTYAGGGLVYTGLGRADAQLGFAFAHARLGDAQRIAIAQAGDPAPKAETSFEVSYSLPVLERLNFQPNIHYIVNPGAEPQRRDALVFGLRLSVLFE